MHMAAWPSPPHAEAQLCLILSFLTIKLLLPTRLSGSPSPGRNLKHKGGDRTVELECPRPQVSPLYLCLLLSCTECSWRLHLSFFTQLLGHTEGDLLQKRPVQRPWAEKMYCLVRKREYQMDSKLPTRTQGCRDTIPQDRR
jgi:hypothetical protein